MANLIEKNSQAIVLMILVSVLQNTNFYYYEFSDSNSSQIIIMKRKLKNSLPINAGPGFLSFKVQFLSTLFFHVQAFSFCTPGTYGNIGCQVSKGAIKECFKHLRCQKDQI